MVGGSGGIGKGSGEHSDLISHQPWGLEEITQLFQASVLTDQDGKQVSFLGLTPISWGLLSGTLQRDLDAKYKLSEKQLCS